MRGGPAAGKGPAADSPCRPESHERSAAMRRRAAYNQPGRHDEIAPETEEIFRNMSAQEKRVNRRM